MNYFEDEISCDSSEDFSEDLSMARNLELADEEDALFRARQCQLENEYKCAFEAYIERHRSMEQQNIRFFGTLSKAREHAKQNKYVGIVFGLFAHERPKRNNVKVKVEKVKQYLFGRYSEFFNYATSAKEYVMLEECVLANMPQRLHFDVEIKRYEVHDGMGLGEHDWLNVLKQHLCLLPAQDKDDVDDNLLQQILLRYFHQASADVTDQECKAGLQIVLQCIEEFVELAVGVELDLKVVSGCRSEKVSFHIVAPGLMVDSVIKSMGVLVFEIARNFQVKNLAKVVSHFVAPNDMTFLPGEMEFRLRALLLFKIVKFEDDSPDFRFVGIDDTPFDEAIYSPNHLLRAPGCCKTTTTALHPVDASSENFISQNKCFGKVFPYSDAGMEAWTSNLVSFRSVSRNLLTKQTCCLCNMEPSRSYPRMRNWLSTIARSDVITAEYIASEEEYRVVKFNAGLPRFEDSRPGRSRVVVSRKERLYINSPIEPDHIEDARSVVNGDDIFKSEDGVKKPFRLFHADEWLYHVHGGVEEKTPSARVFAGGFRCFGCNETFIIPRCKPFEEAYEFFPDEITEHYMPSEYMPDIEWEKALERKFIVISAPMGSGKTEQLAKLFDFLEARGVRNFGNSYMPRVLVISFRQLLAMQQAVRFNCLCYCELSQEQLQHGPQQLTICLNSILKLGGDAYKYIILDECGLIRRHFVSCTIKAVEKVYERFKQHVVQAGNVIMLQDGISGNDIQFYTDMVNVDAGNRQYVYPISFVKPIEIHPIKMTLDFFPAVANLLRCYRESVLDGICRHPIMVFCNSCVMAEFLMRLLQDAAQEIGGALLKSKIKGLWSQIKNSDDFCMRFASNPNEVAHEADAVVCTSVIGAGFSVNRHFEAFHAFFSCDILPFQEEVQFIQRLRFVLQDVPAAAIRESFLFVEKGRGTEQDYVKVKINFDIVRRILINGGTGRRPVYQATSAFVPALVDTEARIQTEKAASRALHDRLWTEYGTKSLNSPFEVLELAVSDSEVAFVKSSYKKYQLARKKDITAFVTECDPEDLSASIAQFELNNNYDLYRLADCERVVETLEETFTGYYNVVVKIIQDHLSSNKNKDNEASSPIITSKRGQHRFIARVHSLVNWLQFNYESLLEDRLCAVYQTWMKKAYRLSGLHKIAHFYLAKNVIVPLLGVVGPESRSRYLDNGGCMPFFVGCRYRVNQALAVAVKERFEEVQGDSDEVKAEKNILRNAYQVLFRKSHISDRCFLELYDVTGGKEGKFLALKMFFREVLRRLGIDVEYKRSTVGRHSTAVYSVNEPMVIFACGLCLKETMRTRLIELLPILLQTPNTVDDDKVWIREAIKMFQETCRLCSVSPRVNVISSNAMQIQQQLLVVPQRMREIQVTEGAYQPVEGFDYDDEESCDDIETGSCDLHDASRINDVCENIETGSIVSEGSYIDPRSLSYEEQIQIAQANFASVERNKEERLKLLSKVASEQEILVYPRQTMKVRNPYIDDIAVEDDEEDEYHDHDTDEHEDTSCNDLNVKRRKLK